MDIIHKLPKDIQTNIFFFLFHKCYNCNQPTYSDDLLEFIDNNETIYICNDCLENKMNNYIDKFSVDLIKSKCTIS